MCGIWTVLNGPSYYFCTEDAVSILTVELMGDYNITEVKVIVCYFSISVFNISRNSKAKGVSG
jgi:peroxiredoxin family protein